MDYGILSMKIDELKNFSRLQGLKVTGKGNLHNKRILCFRKQCSLSEDST